jgi:hypothetical protein
MSPENAFALALFSLLLAIAMSCACAAAYLRRIVELMERREKVRIVNEFRSSAEKSAGERIAKHVYAADATRKARTQ